MSTINPVGADSGLASVQQQLAASQAAGVENIKPETRQNETAVAATEIEHAQSSRDDAQYSHVRYIARNAFMTGQGSGTASLHSDGEGGGYITKKPEASASSDAARKSSPDDDGSGAYKTSGAGSADDGKTKKSGSTTTSGKQLTDAEQEQVKELKSRDSEVRRHELAHQSAGGQYASSPSYDYQTGPDGNRYAIGGHVNIDVSKESSPEKTIEKMQQVIQAARAPAEPSGQDLRVAAEAQQTLAEAQTEKLRESSPSSGSSGSGDSGSDEAQGASGAQGSDAASSASSASDPSSAGGSSKAGDAGSASENKSGGAAQASSNDSSSAPAAPQPRKSLSESTSITGDDSSPTASQYGGTQL